MAVNSIITTNESDHLRVGKDLGSLAPQTLVLEVAIASLAVFLYATSAMT